MTTQDIEKLIFQASIEVSSAGELAISDVPFAPGEAVEVLVFPSRFGALAQERVELLKRSLSADSHRWENASVPAAAGSFEDLAFLFDRSLLNRGLARVDIDEAAAIFRLLSGMTNPAGVEIGRFLGGSTFLMAVAIGEHGKLLSIDIAPRDDSGLREALQSAGLSARVQLVIADANRLGLKETFDFAFIDGDHRYDAAREDHNRWGKRVKPGGILMHHDMSRSRPFATGHHQLGRLKSAILTQQDGVVDLVDEVGSLAVFRRRDSAWVDVV